MSKGLKVLLFILLFIAFIGMAFIYGYSSYQKSIGPVDENSTEDIVVDIPSGTSGYGILSILDDCGLINNVNFAKVYMKLNPYNSLQADVYLLNKSMSLREILNIINTNDFQYVVKETFTVIEGSTIPEAAEYISTQLDVTKQELLDLWSDKTYLNELINTYDWITDDILQDGILYPLEGYLYPDTYLIAGEVTPKKITSMMIDKMDEVINEYRDQINNSEFSFHELLTLASVVQGESGSFTDMPIIAGVFINRLHEPMRLQSDITVLYGIQKKHVAVTYSEMYGDTPYNTYTNDGLPIGPCCLFSYHAIDGVLNYTQSDYYYFFACEDGTVIYSRTYSEHLRAIDENDWY